VPVDNLRESGQLVPPHDLPPTGRHKVANVFARAFATLVVAALAGVFVVLGCILIARGLAIIPGAFLVGRHAFLASAICVLLGITSVAVASFLCLGLFLPWSFIRHGRSGSITNGSWNIEAHLHVLAAEEGCAGSPLYSGLRAMFQHEEVLDDVTLLLVGVSQLASGDEGTVRLSFDSPARHRACLRAGVRFNIVDQEHRRICSGTITRVADRS